jgi:hypothetical protein
VSIGRDPLVKVEEWLDVEEHLEKLLAAVAKNHQGVPEETQHHLIKKMITTEPKLDLQVLLGKGMHLKVEKEATGRSRRMEDIVDRNPQKEQSRIPNKMKTLQQPLLAVVLPSHRLGLHAIHDEERDPAQKMKSRIGERDHDLAEAMEETPRK